MYPPKTRRPTIDELENVGRRRNDDTKRLEKRAKPTTTTTRRPATMDITKFVVSSREKALLYGDYATYRTQLSGRLLNCRKKLNIATKSRGKYHPKGPVTPEQIAENHEYDVAAVLPISCPSCRPCR